MENELAIALDRLLKDTNGNFQKFFSCIAHYLRKNTDFFSQATNPQQILLSGFGILEQNSEEIPLQSNNDVIVIPNDIIVPETEFLNEDNSRDLFPDETQLKEINETRNESRNSNAESVIIPETQFYTDDSSTSDIIDPSDDQSKPFNVTSDGNSELLDLKTKDDNSDGGFFKVAADQNDHDEPLVQSFESQPIMANFDKSILDNFLGSDDSSGALSSTRIELDVPDGAASSSTKDGNQTKKQDKSRRIGDWSGSTTPDVDFEEMDRLIVKSMTSSKSDDQNTRKSLLDTEDLFNLCTQPASKVNGSSSTNGSNGNTVIVNDANVATVNVGENHDDIFDVATQKMTVQNSFTKPIGPVSSAKKRGSFKTHNDSGLVTQQHNELAQSNDDDIFDVATQQVNNDDIYDAPTQVQTDDTTYIYLMATQAQNEKNDVFDASTQRLNVRHESKADSGACTHVPLSQRRGRAFESQLSPVLTPEWSIAKVLPKEPVGEIKKPVSKNGMDMIKGQQWLFYNSDDESDDNNDDLVFDIAPARQNSLVRSSLISKSNSEHTPGYRDIESDSRVKSSKNTPEISENNSKLTNDAEIAEKPVLKSKRSTKRIDVENVPAPTKRTTRSLSIMLSRNEVENYIKTTSEDNQNQKLPKNKAGATYNETTTGQVDKKSKKKFDSSKMIMEAKEHSTSRNLRSKNNNDSLVNKNGKKVLKRKSGEVETDENHRRPYKRTAKETTPLLKVRDVESNNEKLKKVDPTKDVKKTSQTNTFIRKRQLRNRIISVEF